MKTIFKSAVDGRIVSEEYAKDNPFITYEHTIGDCEYSIEEVKMAVDHWGMTEVPIESIKSFLNKAEWKQKNISATSME